MQRLRTYAIGVQRLRFHTLALRSHAASPSDHSRYVSITVSGCVLGCCTSQRRSPRRISKPFAVPSTCVRITASPSDLSPPTRFSARCIGPFTHWLALRICPTATAVPGPLCVPSLWHWQVPLMALEIITECLVEVRDPPSCPAEVRTAQMLLPICTTPVLSQATKRGKVQPLAAQFLDGARMPCTPCSVCGRGETPPAPARYMG